MKLEHASAHTMVVVTPTRWYKKYGFRLLVALFVHTFFQITMATNFGQMFNFDRGYWYYLLFIVVSVLIIWEVLDRITVYHECRYCKSIHSSNRLGMLFIVSFLAAMPLAIVADYFSAYYLKPFTDSSSTLEDSYINFWTSVVQTFVLVVLIISLQVFTVYARYTKRIEIEKANIQKELLLAQYEALKNQVNPHFLFNSFSVLTSLIEQKSDLAGDFLAKLSTMYRYILEHKEDQLVSLREEFNMLKDYIFLLKVRHDDAIQINLDTSIDKDQFHIPTLSLQMLIENAMKHNNFSEKEPLLIDIYTEGDDYLVISNRLKKKNASVKSTKVGLENIRNRYSYESGKEVIIQENSTRFVVKLPILLNPSLA